MNQRRPRTAQRSSALPSLAALLASGVIIDGCDSPAVADERRERLSSHGENAARAFQGSRLGDGLKEIGIGLGLFDVSDTDVGPAGAVPAVDPRPPPMTPGGAVAPVQPTPPPPTPVPHPEGGPMRIDPAPPPPPDPRVLHGVGQSRGSVGVSAVRPHPPVVRPPPTPHLAVPGGLRAVEPGPGARR